MMTMTTMTSAAMLVAALLAAPISPAHATEPSPTAEPSGSQAQRPLVDAATVFRTAVQQSGADGLASIVLEEKSVTVWWKGGLPRSLLPALQQARKIAPVQVSNAAHSMTELLAASAKLERQLSGDPRFHGIKAEPDGSGLIVKTDQAGLRAGSDVGVPTTVSVEPRMQPIARNNDAPPWSGGAQILNPNLGVGCTSGFGVNIPSGPAVLTAGHCGNAGNRFTDSTGEFIGNVGGVDKNFDVLVIPTTASSNRIYVGNGTSNTQRTVTSGGAPFVGELVCQSGFTSANAIGSEICNMRVLFEGTDSQRLWEARQLDGQTAARPGDSGGPVYDDRGDGTVIARGTTTRVAGSGFGFAGFEKAQQDFNVSIPGGPPGNGVVFFQHINFAGASSQVLPVGRHNLASLQSRGFVNDWASSVRIPAGRTVLMYQHDNFTGTEWTRTADTPNFTALQPNANDQVSSVIVQ